ADPTASTSSSWRSACVTLSQASAAFTSGRTSASTAAIPISRTASTPPDPVILCAPAAKRGRRFFLLLMVVVQIRVTGAKRRSRDGGDFVRREHRVESDSCAAQGLDAGALERRCLADPASARQLDGAMPVGSVTDKRLDLAETFTRVTLCQLPERLVAFLAGVVRCRQDVTDRRAELEQSHLLPGVRRDLGTHPEADPGELRLDLVSHVDTHALYAIDIPKLRRGHREHILVLLNLLF